MPVIDAAGRIFGAPPWHHYWAYWHASSLFELLFLPAVVGACALALSVGRAASAGVRRWRAPQRRVDPAPVTSARPVLASDADREDAVRTVSRAAGEARLSLDEATERIDQIWQARHRHELTRFVADLPAPPPPTTGRRARLGVVVAITAGVAAALVQGVFGLWELWPAALVVSVLAAIVRR